MSERRLAAPDADDERAIHIGMAMSAVWLLFLTPSILSLWLNDHALWARVGGTALFAMFVAVYLRGFQVWTRCQAARLSSAGDGSLEGESDGAPVQHQALVLLGLLIAVAAASVAVGGLGMLGMLSFVVALAIFTVSWTISIPIFVLAVVVALGLPAALGELGTLWFFSLIIVAVGTACVLIKLSEEQQIEQVAFRSRLALSDERSRVARDVHDVLGHSLTAVTLKAELCERLLAGADGRPPDDAAVARARAELAELQTITRGAISEIRTTVGGLRTPELADELAAARAVLADAGVSLSVVGEPTDVPERYRSVVGWVVRESVTNIVRHARASSAEIHLGQIADAAAVGGADGRVLVRVVDDGVGFRSAPEGNGMRGLRERIDGIGGRLRTSAGDDGTRIEVVV